MMLKKLCFIFYIELQLHVRRSWAWLYPLSFFGIVISLFPLAFTPDTTFLQRYIAGCVWIAALFASLLSIENIFFTDIEDGHLEQWLLSQMPLCFTLLAKLSAQWIVTQLPLVILTPLLGLLFHLPASAIWALWISLLLGTPILTLTGSLGVALTLGLQQHGVLLNLLILPLVLPVLILGVTIVQQSQAHLPIAGPVAFLAGCFLFSITLIPLGIVAALRVSIDD